MKRTLYILTAVALLLQAPVYAQDHSNVVAEVKGRLQSQGVDLSGACGAFQITNRVALELQGYKLLRKAGGNRAIPQPGGGCLDGDHAGGPGYATDYLISINEGFVGYDLLGDGGGENRPQWLGPEGGAEIIARNVNNAANPVGEPSPAPVPVPVPSPTPVPVPNPSPSVDYSRLLERIIELQSTQLLRIDETLVVVKDTNVRVTNLDRTVAQTLGSISKFVGKYIAPAIGGYLLAHQLNSNTPAVAK